MDEDFFYVLIEKIYNERGLDLNGYKRDFLKRRISYRMNIIGVDRYEEYIKRLDTEEYKKLLDTLLINVTEFLRDSEPFYALQRSIIPAIIESKTKRGASIIRIWSAGCASGEETYSLAILFLEAINNIKVKSPNLRASIWGTDADEDAIQFAKIGKYAEKKLEKIKNKEYLRYFERIDDGYMVKK